MLALLAQQGPDHDPGLAIDGDRLAHIIFTSGSTGLPKGVACTHRAVACHVAWLGTLLPYVADLPGRPELAVICTPAVTVPGIVAQLGALGCKAGVVLSAGLERPAAGACANSCWRPPNLTCCVSSGPTASVCWYPGSA